MSSERVGGDSHGKKPFEAREPQIEAAKLLIKMLEEDGEPVDETIRAVANASIRVEE